MKKLIPASKESQLVIDDLIKEHKKIVEQHEKIMRKHKALVDAHKNDLKINK
jgi:hypothetical protein